MSRRPRGDFTPRLRARADTARSRLAARTVRAMCDEWDERHHLVRVRARADAFYSHLYGGSISPILGTSQHVRTTYV